MTTGNLRSGPKSKLPDLPPAIEAESALVQTVAPGNYTAIVRGKGTRPASPSSKSTTCRREWSRRALAPQANGPAAAEQAVSKAI